MLEQKKERNQLRGKGASVGSTNVNLLTGPLPCNCSERGEPLSEPGGPKRVRLSDQRSSENEKVYFSSRGSSPGGS